jgi:hypothetical protein
VFDARPVLILVPGSLFAALTAEVLIRARDLPGASHLVGLGLLYVAWWVALNGAVTRVSGSPIHWFTVAVPLAAGVLVLTGEVAIARDVASIGEVLSSTWVLLITAAPIVTVLGSRRAKLSWKTGLVAWSLLLYQAAVSIAALTGIAFRTFGTESRADELMFFVTIPPLIALLLAAALAPGLSRRARVASGGLVVLAIPAVLFSTSDGGPGLLLAIVSIGGLLVIIDTIGRRRSDTSKAP